MNKAAVVLLVLALVTLITPDSAAACSCISPASPAIELARSDAVFSGKVVDIGGPMADAPFESAVRVSFKVYRVWKGPVSGTLTVGTAENDAACGYKFENGGEYLVYASGSRGGLTTNLCTRNHPLAGAGEDLAALGEGQVLYTPGPLEVLVSYWPVVVLTLTAMALMGLAFLKRRLLNQPER